MSSKPTPHSHVVTQGPMKDAHNTDDHKQRGHVHSDAAPQHLRSAHLADYVVQDNKVGRILNGRFVHDTKAPAWVVIALTGRNN